MKKIIATWMYCHSEGDKTGYYQVDGGVDELVVQSVYWRCVFSLFASSHSKNKEAVHLLFANQPPPKFLDGQDTESLMNDYAIRILPFPSITRPPKDYYHSWNSQFLLLDVIDALRVMLEQDEISNDQVCMVLDSDCIFNRGLNDEFETDVRKYGALLYTIDYGYDHNINGLSIRELESLSYEYGRTTIKPFIYSGGEFFCALASEIPSIAREARAVYKMSLDRYQRGEKKFNEEAHLLSYVYHKLGYQSHTANIYIGRLWTNSRYFRNVKKTDMDLLIWHLPDQKKDGFHNFFASISSGKILDNNTLASMFRLRQNWMRTYTGYLIKWLHTKYHNKSGKS